MPQSPETNPHERTREDHATELAEDYLEAILERSEEAGSCRVKDLAERFGVAPATVTKMIARLERDGLVETEPYGPVRTTPAGTRIARRSRDRHRVVYAFLVAIGVDEATAAVDAEGIEHHVSKATLDRMRAIVDAGGVES